MTLYIQKKLRDERTTGDNLEQPTPPYPLNSNPIVVPISNDEKVIGTASEPSSVEATHIGQEEKRTMRNYRWRVIAGLFFPVSAWSLNMTMIAAALPFIASDFHQFSQLNWIIAAPELTAAAFVPAFGQLADIFGRYSTLQASVLIMVLGSALCAGAPATSFPMLLAGRGLQGVGSAGIMILNKIILSDKVTLKQQATNNTIFGLVAGIGFGIGPFIGGLLTSVSWRWCFIITIPIALLGLLVTHFLTRSVLLGPQNLDAHDRAEQPRLSNSLIKGLGAIDFGGQIFFIVGMGLLVLALTWAGAYFPWEDVHVLTPLVVGSVLIIVFLNWEYLLVPGRRLSVRYPHKQPMIPIQLLWTRNAGILMYINFITGMAFYAVFYFVDLYFTIVREFKSSEAGINLLYYLPGLGGGTYLAMFVCNIWPRKTWYPLSFGTIVEALGVTLMAVALRTGNLPFVYAMLAVTGFGTGIRQIPNTLHGVGYYRQNIASVVSLMSLATSLGSTLASTIMLNVFNNKMSGAGINLVSGPSSASSFASIEKLPQAEQEYIRQHAKESIVLAFYAISSFCWLGVAAVAFLGNVNIKKRSLVGDTTEDGQTEVGSLSKGAYLGSLFRRDTGGKSDKT